MAAFGQNVQWAIHANSIEESRAKSVAYDAQGNLYVGGFATGQVDFDPSANFVIPTNFDQYFLAKYSPDGALLWVFRIEGIRNDLGIQKVLVDSNNDVLIFGNSERVVDFDPSSNTSQRGNSNLISGPFMAKYSSEGRFIWAEVIGNEGFHFFSSAALDADDNIIITGWSDELRLDFDPSTADATLNGSPEDVSFFIAKYSRQGEYQWARLANNGASFSTDIEVDENGDIYVSGKETGTDLNLGSGTFRFPNDNFINRNTYPFYFLVKYTADGDFIWGNGFRADDLGGPTRDHAVLGYSRNVGIVMALDFYNSLSDSNGNSLYSSLGNLDIAVARFDTNGNRTWINHVASDNQDQIHALDINSLGQIALSGTIFTDLIINDRSGRDIRLNNRLDGRDPILISFNEQGEYDYGGVYGTIEPGIESYVDDLIFDTDTSYVVVGGTTQIDVDIWEGVVSVGQRERSQLDLFMVKYSNGPPIITAQDELQVCILSEAQIPIAIDDDNLFGVNLTAVSSNEDVLENSQISTFRDSRGDFFVRAREIKGYGQTTLELLAVDEYGLTDRKTVILNVLEELEKPVLSISGVLNICDDEPFELTSDYNSNVLWSTGDTTSTITVSESGTYWVKRVEEVACESPQSDPLIVNFLEAPAVPTISASGPLAFCEGESVVLTTNFSDGVEWSNGETTQSITVTEAGIYTVTQNSGTCGLSQPSEPIQVQVFQIPPKPVIQLNGSNRICEGDQVVLSSNLSGEYIWSDGSSGETLEVSTSGIYSLQVLQNNCASPISDSIEIIVDEDFEFSISTESVICVQLEDIELMPNVSSADVDYLWSDGSNFSTLRVTEGGEYWLEVSNGACRKPRTFINVTEACFPIVYLPTAFSPNDDGVNDTFEIKGSRILKWQIQIFNKWGDMVYFSDRFDEQWDGTYNGSDVQAGIYTYRLLYEGEADGEALLFNKSGTIKLIR